MAVFAAAHGEDTGRHGRRNSRRSGESAESEGEPESMSSLRFHADHYVVIVFAWNTLARSSHSAADHWPEHPKSRATPASGIFSSQGAFVIAEVPSDSDMVDVENAPPYDVLMKLTASSDDDQNATEDVERNEYAEECGAGDDGAAELENGDDEEDDDEMLDVESPDMDEMDASDTSSSALGESPQGDDASSTSPENLNSVMLTGDTPHTSTAEVVVLGSVLGMQSSGNHIEKRHICEICGKGFPYHSILESHKRCHTGEKPFNCHFCDKKFAQKATLQVHERTHTGERPYKCRYCEKTFAQYGTKTVHEKSAHLGIRNYKCPKCDKCLSSPSALYTHKKTHGEKTFQCEFCPKTFTLKNYLKLHVKQVHEQNER
ncbi:unnamed protein product, partial [Heligmosomoides polygyrus]|uniref:Protein krueppel n=1 Tax=Heligmosomoides polygyrus TaxID=6339 RepID=A0A183GQJ8_HELPZ